MFWLIPLIYIQISADAVFLDAEDKRREYVLNDQGLTYYGTHKHISCSAWNFGQVMKTLPVCEVYIKEAEGVDANTQMCAHTWKYIHTYT